MDVIWTPNKRQEDFLALPDDIFEGFYGGAAGGGKSEVLIYLPIARQFYKHPKFKGIIFRRTFPELEESIILRAKPIYCGFFGAKYNESKHLFLFPSGATVRCSFLQRDEDARSHDTAEYNYIGFDELTHFSEFQYIYMMSRARSSTRELPAIIRAASNPGNIGHSWVRSRFVEPWKTGYRLLRDKNSKSLRIFIPALATDNTALMENDPEYINRLRNLPLAEQKAKIDGDWWAYAGQVFTEFRSQKFTDEPDNAIHVIEPFDIPKWWPKIIAIDWGWQANTWVGWAAISPDGRLYIYRELVCKQTYIADWASRMAEWSVNDGNIRKVVCDPSAWIKRGEGKTIDELIHEFSGFTLHKADNDRISGKVLYHEMLRWKKKVKAKVPAEQRFFDLDFANRILRMQGKEAYNTYIESFQPEKEEDNLPKLQIFNTCKNLIDVIQSCSYDSDNNENKKKIEDVQEFVGDDAYDGSRYLLKAYDSYITESKREFEQLQKLQIVLDKRANDETSFYRMMAKLERDIRSGAKIQKLYH